MTLLDVGANAEARREHLVQFAFMGAALRADRARRASARAWGCSPTARRPSAAARWCVEAHAELRERARAGSDAFEFVGNVEGGDVVAGAADVIVTDGFTGNIALKLIEGVSQTMLGAVRDAAMSSPRGKLGGLLLRAALRRLPRRRSTPRRQGGAYLLGLRRLGVVPHGRFTRARLRPGDPARRARRARGHRRAARTRALRARRARCGAARPCPRGPLACAAHERS